MPKRGRGSSVMKGRPITAEEFERMLGKVADVLGAAGVAQWQFYLRGVWASGLRLSESLELYWNRQDRLTVDLEGKYPMFRISRELEKGNKDRWLPMAPEFADVLNSVDESERHGRVFKFTDLAGRTREPKADWVGRAISRVGKAAGIKVNTDVETGAESKF